MVMFRSVRARTDPRRMIAQFSFQFHSRGDRFVRDTSLDRAFASWIISFLDWRIPPQSWHIAFAHITTIPQYIIIFPHLD